MGTRCRALVAAELRTIERDLEAAAGRRSALLRRAGARTLLAATGLFLGISLGSWGLGRWASERTRTLAELEGRIAAREAALEQLEARTWGLALHEIEGERYLLLPPGLQVLDATSDRTVPTGRLADGQSALKLAVR